MVEKKTLTNGVRIVYEKLAHMRSCAVGLWVESGSRHEPAELNGISHFIEHMLFKGTERHSAAELAMRFDAIGGQVNAFTTKEHTCYYARTLDTHVRTASELLCDMYFHSQFAEHDASLERSVILEEIGMYEDTPEDLVSEILSGAIYDGCSLARPILGTKDTLNAIDGAALRRYIERSYTPRNTVISLSGSFSGDDLDALAQYFESMPSGTPPERPGAAYKPAVAFRTKDIEQNHLIVAFPGLPLCSEERFAMQVMTSILGGSMGSRLFQKVREESGLCYSIYSFSTSNFDTGVFGVYTALSKDTELQALALIRREIERFVRDGVTDAELGRTKEQLKSNVLMSLESTTARMTSIARNELVYGHAFTEDDIIDGFNAVTRDGIAALAARALDFSKVSFAGVGNLKEERAYLGALRD